MSTCVHVYVCKHTHTCPCVDTHPLTCTHVCAHLCTCVDEQAHPHLHTPAHTCVHTCAHLPTARSWLGDKVSKSKILDLYPLITCSRSICKHIDITVCDKVSVLFSFLNNTHPSSHPVIPRSACRSTYKHRKLLNPALERFALALTSQAQDLESFCAFLLFKSNEQTVPNVQAHLETFALVALK